MVNHLDLQLTCERGARYPPAVRFTALPQALLALIAALLPALPLHAQTERQLLDEVVAVVETHAITLSGLAADTRVKLVESQGPAAADAVLDRKLLSASLRRTVEERVVLGEVERLKLFDLERSEVDNLLARLRARFPSVQKYEAFQRSVELTDDEIGAILARELRVARYLDNRLKLAAELRESELDEAAAGRKLSKPDRDLLRVRLQKEKYLRLLAELLQDLRKRADVRVLDPLDAGATLGKAD